MSAARRVLADSLQDRLAHGALWLARLASQEHNLRIEVRVCVCFSNRLNIYFLF
jgi:hypothetical protein